MKLGLRNLELVVGSNKSLCGREMCGICGLWEMNEADLESVNANGHVSSDPCTLV